MSTDENGMMCTIPCRSRSVTERTVSRSTPPVVPPTVTTSPTLIAFSNWMKMPVDDVLHELLRAEADGEAQHTGRRRSAGRC